MQGLNKWYGTYHALRNINLTVSRGERIVICGQSGSGKSTLIRCINQLETIQEGRIIVDGHDLTAGGKNVDIVR
ncbi:ATP-binding cassette domain-containing protein, partial [Bacillus safensis]|nr:ATP-binding cassette domain-containing protein [Bacillus safensis]